MSRTRGIDVATVSISDDHLEANRLNTALASRYERALADRGREVAERLLAHVRAEVGDYDDFVRRVERAEEFSLHESARVSKTEAVLKVYYMRAIGLLETIQDSER